MVNTDNFRLATQRFKSEVGRDFIYRVGSCGGNTGVYVFVGGANPYTGSDTNVATPNNSVDCFSNAYNNMLYGKVVGSNSVNLMIPRHDWESGTVYDEYSHIDPDLFTSSFYSVVNASAYYHVFKCLYNNDGAESSDPPSFSDTSAEDTYYETADGYIWKYMYSLTKEVWDDFSTSGFMPVIPNANVAANAVGGAIDIIKVEDGGAFYSNYIEGVWNAGDIQIAGNTVLYGITNTASSTNGYYSNCIITIVEGLGKGQYRDIDGYVVNGAIKQITLNVAFSTIPDSTSQYAISPKVVVTGDGKQSSNVVARALINSASSNSVYKIEILSRGTGYRSATASIANNTYVSVSNVATLTPILPPFGGHGANVYNEFGAGAIGISVKFSNTEANTISTDNDYRQIGILSGALWANVLITTLNTDLTAGSNGTFLAGEHFIQGNPVYISGNVSVNTTSAVVVGTGTSFKNVFSNGDVCVVKAGASYFLSNVVSVTNATYMTIGSNCSFLNTAATIARLTVTANGVVNSVGASSLRVGNVSGYITANSFLIGVSTSAMAIVNAYTINGITKNFNTFNQRTVYEGTLTSGTFVEDEVVMQGNASGYFHGIDTISSITKIYLTGESGVFTSGSIIGNTSAAIFTVTAKYSGDFVVDSGQILYVENIQPVSRANNQSEVLKIIVQL